MSLVRIARLIARECKFLFTDWRLLLILLFVPFAYSILFGYIYQPKRVSAISTWVIDEDHSELSRTIRDGISRSDTFSITREDGNMEAFSAATQKSEAFVCFYIPKEFEADVKKGRTARITTFIDGSNMLISNSAMRSAAEIGGTFSVAVQMKRLAMRGTPTEYTQQASQPVETVTRVAYNPAFNYMDFLLPGLLATVLQQVTLLLVALAFAKESELRLFGQILAISKSPLEVLIAKGLTYTVLNLAVSLLVFLLAIKGFGVTVVGSLPLFVLLLTIFISALVAMGLLISAVARDQLFATQVLMLIAVPSFLVSGFTWPQQAMIPAIRALSDALPLTHFVLAMRQIIVQGADISIIRPHLLWLWCLTGVSYLLAWLVIRGRMKAAGLPDPQVPLSS